MPAGEGFSTRQVAHVLGLPASRIHAWARRGLIAPERGPDGAFVFSFQDLSLLRRVRELLDADVPPRRVREALDAIREVLPVGRPLSAVDVSAVGRRVLVRDRDSMWEPNSGQTELDFEGDSEPGTTPIETGATTIESMTTPLEPGPPMAPTADDLYDAALDLEAERPREAIDAYRAVIGVEPGHVEAHLNLGRILHEAGATEEAERHYRTALASDEGNASAWYNLGVVLQDENRTGEARRAYERAVELDPELAAAHFNLSRLLEADGLSADALGHLLSYRRIIGRATTSESEL